MLKIKISPVYEAGEMVGAAVEVDVFAEHIQSLQESYDGYVKLYVDDEHVGTYEAVGGPGDGIGKDSRGCYLLAKLKIEEARILFPGREEHPSRAG